MAQQKIVLAPKGLYTNVNQLGTVPPGALSECNNAVLSRPNVLGVRRGRITTSFFSNFVAPNFSIGAVPLRLFNADLRVGGTQSTNYLGTTVHGVISVMADGTMYWSPDGITFTQVRPTYGLSPMNLSAFEGERHYYGFQQGNAFYLATASGVIRVGRPLPNSLTPPINTETLNDQIRAGYSPAGVPAGLNAEGALYSTTPPPLAAINVDSQVAYRFTYGFRDSGNTVHIGAPTNRAVVINPSGKTLANARLSTIIPPGINKYKHFWQLYRTLASGSANIDPGDDEGLIAEGPIPSDLVVDQLSRAAVTGLVNIRTTTPHGLSVGQNINLKQDFTATAAGPTIDEFFVYRTPASTTRVIYRKLASTTGFVQTGTFTSNAQFPTARPLFVRDPVARVFYYYESSSSQLHVISEAGAFIESQSISTVGGGTTWIGDKGCYDFGSRKFYFMARKTTDDVATMTYNGTGSVFWSITYDPIGKYVTNQYQTGGIPNDGVLLHPQDVVNYANLGVWRKNRATATYLVFALPSLGNAARVCFSDDSGYSWTYQFCNPAINHPVEARQIPFGNDTVEIPTTQETVFMFALTTRDARDVPLDASDLTSVNVYYVNNGGLDSPLLSMSPFTWSGAAQGVTPVVFNNVQGRALRVNRVDGSIWLSIKTPQGYTNDNFLSIKTWGAQKWVPSTVGEALYNPAAGTTLGLSDTDEWSTNCDAVDTSPTAQIITLTGGTLPTNARFYKYSWAAGVVTETFITVITSIVPFVDIGIRLQSATGQSTSATALIPAGLYKIVGVVDATHVTFTATQVPDVPIALMTVAISFEQTEIVYIDAVNPIYIGPYIYTAPSVEGMLQANYPPPYCRDAASFRTTGFYANALQPVRIQMTMLSLPTVGERIYLGPTGSFFITAGTVENAQTRVFAVSTAGMLNENTKNTIASIARVINFNWRTFFTLCFPVGVGTTQWTTFSIAAVLPDDALTFKYTNAAGTALVNGVFTPNDIYGESAQEKNILYYSKPNIPDAVPLLNSLRIGSDTKEILRIIASRDALFVFKEDGAFIVRGYTAPWQVDPFDLTLELAIPDSLVVLDNAVFGAFSRGIFKVTDSNAELVSLPVQDLIERQLSGDLQPNSADIAFGCADNPDHKYILWYPESVDEVSLTSKALVFDTFTNEWTHWTHPSRHAITFNRKSLLFSGQALCKNSLATFANGNFPCILKENKSLTDADFFDDVAWRIPTTDPANNGSIVQITNYDPVAHTVTFGNTATNWGTDVGEFDIVVPGGEDAAYPNAIMFATAGTAGRPVPILNQSVNWLPAGNAISNVKVFRGIAHSWKFVQSFPESPAATNHFSELAVSFRQAYWSKLRATFSLPSEQQDPLSADTFVDFTGIKHFGVLRMVSKNNFIRTYVPRQSQRGTTLTAGISTGACGKAIESNGMTLILTQGPTSFQRR